MRTCARASLHDAVHASVRVHVRAVALACALASSLTSLLSARNKLSHIDCVEKDVAREFIEQDSAAATGLAPALEVRPAGVVADDASGAVDDGAGAGGTRGDEAQQPSPDAASKARAGVRRTRRGAPVRRGRSAAASAAPSRDDASDAGESDSESDSDSGNA